MPPLETPSKSQENMSTSPEEAAVSPIGKESGQKGIQKVLFVMSVDSLSCMAKIVRYDEG